MSGAPKLPSSKAQLWLIKAESAGRTEAYQEEAEAKGFEVRYLPPLAERYETAELEELLSRKGSKWYGVIITSKRGAEGWIRAVKALEARGGFESAPDLSKLAFYTVGTTSTEVLAASGCAKSLLPDLGRVTSAKTATLLAEHMLEQLSTFQPDSAASRSYLFIRGDKSANNLQPILRDAGHTVYETQVYSTSLNPEFAGLVKSEIASLAAGDAPGRDLWLAFFSPSSAGYALPYLTPLLDSAAVGETGPRVRVAAIGETSRAYLAESGITVHAVADQPNARGLVGAITSGS